MTVFERTIRSIPIKTVNWEQVSDRTEDERDISLSFIREYQDYLNWDIVSQARHTLKFYREFRDKVVWWRVFQIGISERKIKEFVNELEDEFDWEMLCEHTKLSKKFIKRYEADVCWDSIFWQDHLGKQFMIENKDRFSDDVDIDLVFREWGIDRDGIECRDDYF